MVPFIFGLILGILCMIYLPKYVQPYLPDSIAKKETVLRGTVVAKEKKGDTLLLTVNTPEGALLATFKQKTGEIGRLINEKDEVQFSSQNYMPFIDDPKIIRVVKEQPPVTATPATVETPTVPAKPVAAAAPPGKSTKNTKTRRQVKLQAAAPTPKKAIEIKPQVVAPAPENPTEVKPPDQGNNEPPASDKKTEQ